MIAITRDVSPAIGRCELTHLERTTIEFERARAQHAEYVRCLADAGCTVERLPSDEGLADSVFVEDIAVVFDELALIARPGAPSRRAEIPAVAEAVGHYRTLRVIEAPGTCDGGDVLVIGRRVFVGRSSRTNAAGIEQMKTILGAYGYAVEPVGVVDCLHLKSAVTAIADDTLLINRNWTAADRFADFTLIDVDPAEPFAANALRLGDAIVYPAAYAWTRRRLEDRGFRVRTVDASELAKAEGGVTCCSLILPS